MAARKKHEPLSIAHPNAAGIDIGSASHFVAVPPNRDDEPVREFRSFTGDLLKLADWLQTCGVDTVAMESTGVYWIPLYELLQNRGFIVHLVNARHVKNVSGRKSDVLDCQWLQQLMSYGLLRGAFRPDEAICALRSIMRTREMLLEYQADHIRHMQKALTQMNIQLHNVIADVAGVSGQAIIRAILKGERDPEALAALCDRRIRASREEVAKSLHGNWREEHLFALQTAVNLFDTYHLQMQACDKKLEAMLAAMQQTTDLPPGKKRPSTSRNAPRFDVRTYLFQMLGVDLTAINGIDVNTALKVIAEIGPDLSRFKSAKHFASWLGLCPGTKISGGKILSGKTRRTNNRAAQALRIAAAALRNSKSALGAYHRKMLARMDNAKAVTATAHKLARIIFALLTKGQAFVDQGEAVYEERHRQRTLRNLANKAAALGFALAPLQQDENGNYLTA